MWGKQKPLPEWFRWIVTEFASLPFCTYACCQAKWKGGKKRAKQCEEEKKTARLSWLLVSLPSTLFHTCSALSIFCASRPHDLTPNVWSDAHPDGQKRPSSPCRPGSSSPAYIQTITYVLCAKRAPPHWVCVCLHRGSCRQWACPQMPHKLQDNNASERTCSRQSQRIIILIWLFLFHLFLFFFSHRKHKDKDRFVGGRNRLCQYFTACSLTGYEEGRVWLRIN